MLPSFVPDQIPNLRAFDAVCEDTTDVGTWLAYYGVKTTCSVLGGANAWVSRHLGESCDILMVANPPMEFDSQLQNILVHSEKNCRLQSVLLTTSQLGTLLCVSLSAKPEADGCTYMLSMVFTGPFELTEFLKGVVEGLRCSLLALISQQIANVRLESMDATGMRSVVCSCCRRMHIPEHGWMHWDDLSFLRAGRSSSRTVCEQCALAIYDDVLQGNNPTYPNVS
jgi:hypothetical protein